MVHQSSPQPETPLPPRDPARTSSRRQRRSARKSAEAQAVKRQQRTMLFGAIIAAVIVAGFLIYLNRPQTPGADIVAADPLPANIPLNGMTMGAADAPVQMVEWGDYQCPACGILARSIEPQLVSEFIEPGKASFEFRNFAFLGPESQRAAAAAVCADEQDAFWPFHDTLYANQHGENQGAFSDDRLRAMAEKVGLDMPTFNTCLDDAATAGAVAASTASGRDQGVNATPWLTVNGTRVENWQDWSALSAAIEAAAK
ncbi:MAG: thioredoxin domain-containing protein [Thermomicrobiales bacterium]